MRSPSAPGARFGPGRRARRLLPLTALGVLMGSGALPCHWAAVPLAVAQTPTALEVRISLTEWALTPGRVAVPAGRLVRFVAANNGALPHALAVEGAGLLAETDAVGSRQVARLELTFAEPGIYDLYCPVNAGQHRALGQEGVLTVLPAGAPALLPRTGGDPAEGAPDLLPAGE